MRKSLKSSINCAFFSPTEIAEIRRNGQKTNTVPRKSAQSVGNYTSVFSFLPLIPQRFAELNKKPTQFRVNPRNLWEIISIKTYDQLFEQSRVKLFSLHLFQEISSTDSMFTTRKQLLYQFINCFLVVFVQSISFAQENLIVNPNCDIYDTCPDNMGQITRANGWWKFDSFGTPDFLNNCSTHPMIGVPSDIGYQLPLSGSGYFHSSILNSYNPQNFQIWNGQEYIQSRESFIGTLIQPLKKVPHIVEFYVNFSNKGYSDSFGGGDGRIATNAFDFMLLESNQVVYNSVIPYINKSEIINMNEENIILNDTLNWVKLSSCFVPSGNEFFFLQLVRSEIQMKLF